MQVTSHKDLRSIPRCSVNSGDTVPISDTDPIALGVPGTINGQNNGAVLVAAHLIVNATRYVAVCTAESVNGSAAVYTELAKVKWKLDESGTVVKGVYNGAQTNAFSGPKTFEIVDDGSVVPITIAPILNDATAQQQWN